MLMIDTTVIRGGLILALLVPITMSAVANPLDDLEEALRRQGFSASRAAEIVSEADGASWEEISSEVDFAAVARSLTVESFADSSDPGDLAELAHDLAQEAETLKRLGFTRREVALSLSEGVRAARGAESIASDIPSQAAAAAARLSRGSLRRDMQEIAGRRGPLRGMIPSGVAQRNLDLPVPGGGRPVSNGPEGPDEAPDTPGNPGGR